MTMLCLFNFLQRTPVHTLFHNMFPFIIFYVPCSRNCCTITTVMATRTITAICRHWYINLNHSFSFPMTMLCVMTMMLCFIHNPNYNGFSSVFRTVLTNIHNIIGASLLYRKCYIYIIGATVYVLNKQ